MDLALLIPFFINISLQGLDLKLKFSKVLKLVKTFPPPPKLTISHPFYPFLLPRD